MPREFELVDADFGADVNKEIEEYVHEQIDWLEQSHQDLHKSKIPKWRKLYIGTPAEETRSFPWANASNVVIQAIGETVDTLVAWVVGLIYATHPMWVYQNYAKAANDQEKEDLETQRRVLEDFMDLVGYEPSELDLQTVESLWYTDTAKLGTGFVKLNMEDRIEAVVTGYTDSKKKTAKGNEKTLYFGPAVSKLRHEDISSTPDAASLRTAEFTYQTRTLRRKALEERGFMGIYDKDAVETIIGQPDRQRPKQQSDEELQQQGVNVRGPYDATAEWDLQECYFAWWHNKRKYRLIFTYHKLSKTKVRCVFNFLPDNELPIIRARLGYKTDGMYGHGLGELLERYQEELSTIHNQRIDNSTAANTRALRVSPRARNLDSNIELYPMALLVGEKDEIEAFQIADVYPSSFENEEMTLRHVERRAGISPAIAGSGQGGMGSGKQKNVYSAMGTFATMQAGNRRSDLDASDFRHSHVQLGMLLSKMYAHFGTGGREEIFGLDAKHLTGALDLVKKNLLRIPMRAATASLNREVEKQSDMLMVGLLQRHYTAIGQAIQSASSPVIPPELRDYLTQMIKDSNRFMKRILKDFGYDQPDQFIPDPKVQNDQQTGKNPQAPGGGQVAPEGSSMGGAAAPSGQVSSGMVPGGGGGGLPPGVGIPPQAGR